MWSSGEKNLCQPKWPKVVASISLWVEMNHPTSELFREFQGQYHNTIIWRILILHQFDLGFRIKIDTTCIVVLLGISKMVYQYVNNLDFFTSVFLMMLITKYVYTNNEIM